MSANSIIVKTAFADDIRRLALERAAAEDVQAVVDQLRTLYQLPAPFFRSHTLAVSGEWERGGKWG